MKNLIRALALVAMAVNAADSLAQKPPAGPSTVTIAPHGALLIDGKPVFPIGFTMPPPADGKTPDGKDAIGELADAGATFLRTGPMGAAWDEAQVARELAYLDAAARHGMHCATNLRELSSLPEGNAQREAKLRALVERFKGHPGLGVWKGVDEPEWGKHPVEPMVRARELINKVDGRHPLFVVQAPRGTVETLKAYDPTYDITGADVYPVGYPPGQHSVEANKNLSMVGDFTKRMTEVAGGKKPVWMVLQISFSGTIKPGKTLRMPTFPQTRYMTYQAITNGARGLLYFGGHIEKAMPPEEAKLGWNWTHWRRVLRPVIEEIGSKSPLYPALVAADSALPVKCATPGVEFVVREVGPEVFVIACKREGETVQAKFTGLPAELKGGDVMFESPRTVEVKEGTLADWFGPEEVHLYRLRR